MNRVILTGRFTRDPEMRASANGEVARYSLACQSDFVSRSGEREAEFINCVSFGNTASLIGRYCKKGNLISATGRIRNSSYDARDGSKRYTTDVVVDSIEFLGSRSGEASGSYSQNNNFVQSEPSYSQANDFNSPFGEDLPMPDMNEDPYKDFGEEITVSNDDLPF